MQEKQKVQEDVIHSVLALYGLDAAFCEQREYIDYNEGNLVKIILSVLLESGKRVVIKILRESDALLEERNVLEKQSAFSELMRQNGVETPLRYAANGNYCTEYVYNGLPCNVTVEDWCGEEITAIDVETSYKIGALMARMHRISLKNRAEIGCGTLFSAAYRNDVDVFESFCRIGENENLDQTLVIRIKELREEKLAKLRSVWSSLPKAAVQGDVSVNNLVRKDGKLHIFDYNNAGDEVLVSDLVMEGLLTAYEMELPEGTDKNVREVLFPAFLNGYLSVRRLSKEESSAAWDIYTLYRSLWFTKIVYNEDSLEKLVERKDYEAANRLLRQMYADITESNDGRFEKGTTDLA